MVVGIQGLLLLEWDRGTVLLRRDSVTALTLATKSNFRSERVVNVSTVYTAQCAIGKVRVVQTQTSTSEEIWRTDKLSRAGAGESWEGLGQGWLREMKA